MVLRMIVSIFQGDKTGIGPRIKFPGLLVTGDSKPWGQPQTAQDGEIWGLGRVLLGADFGRCRNGSSIQLNF